MILLKRTKEQQEKNREAYDSYYVHYYEEAHTRNLTSSSKKSPTSKVGDELRLIQA